MFMDRKIHYCHDVSSSQHALHCQFNPNENCSMLFCGYQQTASKVNMQRKNPRIYNMILKEKNKVVEPTFPTLRLTIKLH